MTNLLRAQTSPPFEEFSSYGFQDFATLRDPLLGSV